MNKIRIIWKRKSDTKIGYLRLSFRKDSKTILRSIGIEGIEEKFFNPKEQRLRKSHPNHEVEISAKQPPQDRLKEPPLDRSKEPPQDRTKEPPPFLV